MKAISITNEHTTCDCCGKNDLQKTVALQDDNGDVVFFGVVCAARALTGKNHTAASARDTIAADITKSQAEQRQQFIADHCKLFLNFFIPSDLSPSAVKQGMANPTRQEWIDEVHSQAMDMAPILNWQFA